MRRQPAHAERGQTLPMWIIGILTTFTLLWFTLDYANAIRWQVRAQNAADAAASSLISLQTSRYDEMLMVLYAADIDEWRLRNLIEGMDLAVLSEGGCANSGNCSSDYSQMRTAYIQVLNRYTSEINLLQGILGGTTLSAETAAANAIVTAQNGGTLCGQHNGWDCGFQYTLQVAPTPRTQVFTVEQDGASVDVGTPGVGTLATISQDLAPAHLEIVACANVHPLIPAFFKLSAGIFQAVGRADSTSAAVTQEWLQPGQLEFPSNDPKYAGLTMQPTEQYVTTQSTRYSNNYDWYGVTYGGAGWTAQTGTDPGYTQTVTQPEFAVTTSWFAPMPYPPSGDLTLTAGQCK
jgi:hypothetical protein